MWFARSSRLVAPSTSMSGSRLYCARGQAENHIKAWKNHLAADRTSCHEAEANQFRLFLHAGAYWLLWSMRRVMPNRSIWRVMPFDTLRLRLIKTAALVVELPDQDPPAVERPRADDLRHPPRPTAVSRYLKAGADARAIARFPLTPSAYPMQTTRPAAAGSIPPAQPA
jgi:hypothetical protein